MNPRRQSSRRVGAWLPPFCFIVLLVCSSCAPTNRSLLIGPEGTTAQVDAFPEIVRQADQTFVASEGDFDVVVRYPVELQSYVEPAVEALRRPIEFLQEATGLREHGKVEAYLHPLAPGDDLPHYQPRGRADFTIVFLVSEGEPLLADAGTRQWYLYTLPHELAHTFLSGLPIEDRWLEDGLAEHLQTLFVRAVVDELPGDLGGNFPSLRDVNPGIEALRRVEWERWRHQSVSRLMKLQRTDPALAAYELHREVWKYSAAAELLDRWLAAAADAGVTAPLLDLIQRIKDHDGRIHWQDTRGLVRAQTGHSLEEIVKVESQDLEAARQWAWSERLSARFPTRIRALKTLTFVGLPDGVATKSLMPSFELPRYSPKGPYVDQVLTIAASGAVAASGNVNVAAEAADLLRDQYASDVHWYSHPDLWGLVAETDRRTALRQLMATVRDPRAGLAFSDRANELLEDLTDRTVGWAVELSPDARQQAASRWLDVIPTVDVNPESEATE